jgi:DNA transformation protein
MAVTPTFQAFVLEQLGRVTPVLRAKPMFGGVGIYAGERFFALIDDDVLYLKADEVTRPEFLAAGMPPFQPFGDGTQVMQYYAVSADLLEDADALDPWVARALAAAGRKRQPKPKPKRGRPERD